MSIFCSLSLLFALCLTFFSTLHLSYLYDLLPKHLRNFLLFLLFLCLIHRLLFGSLLHLLLVPYLVVECLHRSMVFDVG